MTEQTWCSFDFGSAYIRVARARSTADPAAVGSELVSFHDRPALPNLALLAPDASTLEAVGVEIADLDESALDHNRVYAGASLEDDPESEGGRVARLLLAYIVDALRRDYDFPLGTPALEGLIAVPIASRNVEQTRHVLESNLCNAGFATATAKESAFAALVHYTRQQPAPGHYLIIDAGHVWTRFALIESRPSEPLRVVASGRDRPGGRDFDMALLNYFATAHDWAGDPASDRRARIVDFKHRFARAWAEGRGSLTSQEMLDGHLVTLSLDTPSFISPGVAGPLIEDFQRAADAFVEQHLRYNELTAIVLSGGGANWPFVLDWARRRVEPDKVLTDQYPEQAIAHGLLRLAAIARGETIQPPHVDPVQAANSNRSRPAGHDNNGAGATRPPQRMVKPILSPGLAAIIEFLFGLVGFLGLGWFLGAKRVVTGFVVLFAWWLALLVLVLLGAVSALSDRPAQALALVSVWVGVPLVSSMLVYRVASRLAHHT